MVGKNYETLNAMRGVAAIAVMLFHGGTLIGVQFMPHGYLAVDLFFALSGFVIAHAYGQRLEAGLGWRGFTRIRLIRFYPLYVAGLALGILREIGLLAAHNHYAYSPATLVVAIATALLFIPFPTPDRDYNLFSMNVPSWSLLYELLVNIAYAVLFPLLSSRVLVIIAGLFGAGLIYLTISAGSADLGALAPDASAGVARTIFSFSVGLLLHRLRPSGAKVPPQLLLIILAGSLAAPVAWSPGYDLIFIIALSPALIALGAAVEPGRYSRRTFVYLGVISFPLYALHQPLLLIAEGGAKALHLPGPVVGVVAMVVLVAICPILDRIYDRPARNLLSWIFRSRASRDAALPAN